MNKDGANFKFDETSGKHSRYKNYGVRFILTLILFLLCYVAVMYCGVLLLVNRHGLLHFLLH
ncbi:hypothetical protein EBO33_02655 [[Curtobacterium] plantarum]|nr:hypothetical protein CBF16_09940 [Pantoea agglomerans]MCL6410591.1 hypothetical protein [Pantoea agglomerans]RNA78940.1 hypothetical protein EBO33_02655 [[Curtobacterium] plantarum]